MSCATLMLRIQSLIALATFLVFHGVSLSHKLVTYGFLAEVMDGRTKHVNTHKLMPSLIIERESALFHLHNFGFLFTMGTSVNSRWLTPLIVVNGGKGKCPIYG